MIVIRTTEDQRLVPEIAAFIEKMINAPDDTGDYVLRPTPDEENRITQAEFEACFTNGCIIRKAMCFVEMTLAKFAEEVPEFTLVDGEELSWPYRRYEESPGVWVTRTWAEYAPFHWTNDTHAMVRCVHVKRGEEHAEGTTYTSLRRWYTEFGKAFTKKRAIAKLIADYPSILE